MIRFVLALALTLFAAPAFAQNTQCSDRPASDSSNACANTRFVQNHQVLPGSIPLTQYHFLIGNASAFAADIGLTGDCTYGASGIICTKTNGVAFGAFATGTDSSNLTGLGADMSASGGLHLGAFTGDVTKSPASLATTVNAIQGLGWQATTYSNGQVPTWNSSNSRFEPGTSGTNCTIPQGRVTLISGTPYMVSTVTAATTIYYAPAVGQCISIFNGTSFAAYQFTSSASDTVGLTLTLGSNWAGNSAFDVYVGLDAGVPVLCTVAWTNPTTPATTVVRYSGLVVNSTSATCRTSNTTTITCAQFQCTYVGAFLTAASAGQVTFDIGGSGATGPATAGRIVVWNLYNQIEIQANTVWNGARYTYTSVSPRQAGGSATMNIGYFVGQTNTASINAYYFDNIATAAVLGAAGGHGLGLDSVTAYGTTPVCSVVASTANIMSSDCQANVSFLPLSGYHYIALLEESDGTNAMTFSNVNSERLNVKFRM